MNNLYTEIKNTISLPKESYSFIAKNSTIKTYSKGDAFLKIGTKNTLLGFLEKGLLRSFFINEEGNEITTGFIEEGSFFTDMNSFSNKSRSERTIEAIEQSQIVLFNEQQQKNIREQVALWSKFEQLYYEKMLKAKVNFQRKLTQSNTTNAYKLFSQEYSQAVKYAPRKQIASFLGMSPYTLSRIKL